MNKRTLIIAGIVGAVAIGTYLYIKKMKKESGLYEGENQGGGNVDTGGSNVSTIENAPPMSADQNYATLKSNLGGSFPSGSGFKVKFNKGNNFANFYNNNRFAIQNKNGDLMFKGTYQQGGKSLKADNGKIAVSGSVWGNLLNIIK